jgi:hypothetical protein
MRPSDPHQPWHGQHPQWHGHAPHQQWHGHPHPQWHGHPHPQWHGHPQQPRPASDRGRGRALLRFAVLFGFALGGMPVGCLSAKAMLPDGAIGSVGIGVSALMLPLAVVLGARVWWFLADMRDAIRTYNNARSGPRSGAWAFIPVSSVICSVAGLVLGLIAAPSSAIAVAVKLGLLGAAFGGLLFVLARAGAIPSEEEGA